jgi:uncharacterized protein (DUF362 family)
MKPHAISALVVSLPALAGIIVAGALSLSAAPRTPPRPASERIPETVAGTEAIRASYAASGGATIYVKENTDAADDGVSRLLSALKDPPFYQQGAASGMVAAGDVILIKINSQWDQRGGTNTDLLKALIQHIVAHPDGFQGEIIIADNGQGMFGSARQGGRMDWENTNAKDRRQSAQDVADFFEKAGHKVSAISWDKLTKLAVREFQDGDATDGFVVEEGEHSSGLIVSYAKFTTKFGAKVSFKRGLWNETRREYDSARLKIINAPVLKAHGQYQVTGAVKSYMGVPSNSLTHMSPHNSVGRGGMGTLMANTRFPTLNLLDMVYIAVTGGPNSPYNSAVAKNMIAASTDPVALDWWASKNILAPAAESAGNRRASSMSPEPPVLTGKYEPGTFGYWLNLSFEELKKAGIPVIMDGKAINVITL